MEATWRPVQAAAGPIRVWLPAGARLEDVGGVEYWSPDAHQGRFTVASTDGEDGERLLAAERAAGGEVIVELDEKVQRGGVDVRRLRYRVRHREPREVLVGEDGETRHTGGTPAEHLSDVLVLRDGDRVVRAGYSVRTDADPELRATFAEILDRVDVGSER
jgi:hypothetical protein